jgi:CubicO group peptidase (beta-lactamase class C family)
MNITTCFTNSKQAVTFLKSIFFFSIVFLSKPTNAQLDFSTLNKKLDSYKSVLGSHYACIIQKDSKVLYKKDNEDYSVKDAGALGSASQWLTAALVLWYVDQGKLTLEDKVSDYLPIFETYGMKYISIRHCLSGQTGIEPQKGAMKLFEKNKFDDLGQEVDAYASKNEIMYNPGTGFSFNPIGSNIAGRVVEVVSKKSFEQMVAEKILRPLSMKSTSFSGGDMVNPANSATSSAVDMGNFLSMLLNKGMFMGRRVLSEKAVADMETLQMDSSFMKYVPKPLKGFTFGMDEWILDKDADGKSTVVGFPNMNGSLFFIDKCRGYSFVLLTKDLRGETGREMYLDIKKTIDAIIPDNGCAIK